MKKYLFPAMFIIALAGSAFTRFSKSSKADIIAYYPNIYGTSCETMDVVDDNCIPDELDYICKELTPDLGWQTMYENAFGSACWQPYYSYYQNGPGN